MNTHPVTTPASPSLASPLPDALCDSIDSLTTIGAVSAKYAYTTYSQPTILNASGSPIGNRQSQIASRIQVGNGTKH
ncbi:MAG: hypothetical protein MUC43_09145 [Pirellula sp.]|nr:hypothetical protein [Pirellula sp.]